MNNNNSGLSMLPIVLGLLTYNVSNVSGCDLMLNVVWDDNVYKLVIILFHLLTLRSVIEVWESYHNDVIYLLRVLIKKVYLLRKKKLNLALSHNYSTFFSYRMISTHKKGIKCYYVKSNFRPVDIFSNNQLWTRYCGN